MNSGARTATAAVCNSMLSMIGGSGGMPTQKILKIRCSEVHFRTFSSEIEHRKVVKKTYFLRGHYSLCMVCMQQHAVHSRVVWGHAPPENFEN